MSNLELRTPTKRPGLMMKEFSNNERKKFIKFLINVYDSQILRYGPAYAHER